MTPLFLSLFLSLAPLGSLLQEQQTPAQAIESVLAEFDEKFEAWQELVQAAENEEERKALLEENPTTSTLERLSKLVKDVEPSHAAAFSAAHFIVTRSRSLRLPEGTYPILRAHADRDELAEVIARLSISWDEEGAKEALLRHLLAESKSLPVRGTACYQLASGFKYRLDRMQPEPEEAARLEEEALALYGRGLTEFKEVDLGRGTFGERAEKDTYELKNLMPGKVAPDIEGEDLGGTAFKLSDYRGKVILLDFWGDW